MHLPLTASVARGGRKGETIVRGLRSPTWCLASVWLALFATACGSSSSNGRDAAAEAGSGGSGGATGSGGAIGTGGATGSGGTVGSGGVTSTGGTGSGGAAGRGGGAGAGGGSAGRGGNGTGGTSGNAGSGGGSAGRGGSGTGGTSGSAGSGGGSAGRGGGGGAGGRGGSGGSAGAGGQVGGCVFSASYSIIETGGLLGILRTTTLTPPMAFQTTKRVPLSDAGTASCSPAMPTCRDPAAIDVADIETAVAHPDVQAALGFTTNPFFGERLVADAGEFSFLRVTGGGFNVGLECNTPSATCTVTPGGVKALMTLVRGLVTQQLTDAACAAAR